jgi:hypothetical protein
MARGRAASGEAPGGRLRWLALAALATAAAAAAWCATVRPSNARTWRPEQSVLVRAVFEGHRVTIHDIRDFAWNSLDRYRPGYYDATFDLDSIESVWFVLTPLSANWRGPAHSFLSFGFAGSRFVAISVEARKEPDETYSALRGLLRGYELMYVVGDERDLIGLRVALGEDVFVYPIRASREKVRQLFVEMLERANELRERPEFYNTFTSNCTTNIVRHVNRIAPREIPYGPRILLPGYSDALALDLGLLDTDLPLDEARRRFRVNERAERYAGRPEFSARIREP